MRTRSRPTGRGRRAIPGESKVLVTVGAARSGGNNGRKSAHLSVQCGAETTEAGPRAGHWQLQPPCAHSALRVEGGFGSRAAPGVRKPLGGACSAPLEVRLRSEKTGEPGPGEGGGCDPRPGHPQRERNQTCPELLMIASTLRTQGQISSQNTQRYCSFHDDSDNPI